VAGKLKEIVSQVAVVAGWRALVTGGGGGGLAGSRDWWRWWRAGGLL
jgi:hypothetical protein